MTNVEIFGIDDLTAFIANGGGDVMSLPELPRDLGRWEGYVIVCNRGGDEGAFRDFILLAIRFLKKWIGLILHTEDFNIEDLSVRGTTPCVLIGSKAALMANIGLFFQAHDKSIDGWRMSIRAMTTQ